MKTISRRNMLKTAGSSVGMAVLGVPVFFTGKEQKKLQSKVKHKVLVIGAHPDDAETGCGGTMTLLSKAGHEVVSVYLTRGEAGVSGKTHEQASQIRTREALKACEIMGARPEFLGQIDGNCEITSNRYTEMYDFIQKEKPDVVLTHWPIDGHRDHRICSVLVFDAWLKLNRKFDLYYFEVESGQQSQHFAPTDFVDIESVLDEKHKACYCHASQHMDHVFKTYHNLMEQFRGLQNHCNYAEAFVKLHQVPGTLL